MPSNFRKGEEGTAEIVVFGESGTGKTCFTDMFLTGKPFALYNAVEPEMRGRTISVDNKDWLLSFMDLSSTVLHDPDPNLNTDMFKDCLARADGVVLMYDITCRQSFDDRIDEAYMYAWLCRRSQGLNSEKYLTGRQRFGCVLVGNKADVVREDPDKREVSKDMAEQWAQSQGFKHFEVSSNERGEIETAVGALVKSIIRMGKRDAEEIEEKKKLDQAEERRQKRSQKNQNKASLGNVMKQVLGKKNSTS